MRDDNPLELLAAANHGIVEADGRVLRGRELLNTRNRRQCWRRRRFDVAGAGQLDGELGGFANGDRVRLHRRLDGI